MGAKVAVKRVTVSDGDEEIAIFKKEAQTLAALRHPNIVSFFGVAQNCVADADSEFDINLLEGGGARVGRKDHWLMIEEYCSGGSLKDMLSEGGAFSRDAHFAIFTNDLLSGLVCLHKNNCVHRDIKPGLFVCLFVSCLWFHFFVFDFDFDRYSSFYSTPIPYFL